MTEVQQSEFEGRWRTLRARMADEGLDAVVVFSRGGGPIDSAADVFYLSNHNSPFPMIADLRPHWAGRAHSAFLLAAEGEPALVTDHPDWRPDLIPFDDVRFALDVPGAAAKLLAERGLASSRVGLVGRSAMLAAVKDALLEASPATEFAMADDLVELIRAIKSPRELDRLRAAGAIGDRVVGAVVEAALTPGTTEAQAVASGYKLAAENCVALYDAAIASGPHSDYYAYGRMPSWTDRALERGDFFHIDTYGALDGYLYDFARCCVVGGEPSEAQQAVMNGVIDSVEAGVALAAPGVSVGDMYERVHSVLRERDLLPEEGDASDGAAPTSALSLSFPAHGHSFGIYWEKPWLTPGGEELLEEHMCIGIEAMGGLPGVGSVKFEQDVIITADGCELITNLDTRFW